MSENLEMKRMVTPKEKNFKNGLKINDYLIQNAGCDNYLIHREISPEEYKEFKDDEIFEYEGKKYLACIANFPSGHDAELAINSYWNALKTLNNFSIKEKENE